MLFSVGFHENIELRQRFDDRVDYMILNNSSSLDLEAHVKRRNRAKHETFSVLDEVFPYTTICKLARFFAFFEPVDIKKAVEHVKLPGG